MKNLVRILAAAAAIVAACPVLAWQGAVGKLTHVKNLTLAPSASGRFTSASVTDSVFDGNSIRTARRGCGEITFVDNSVLRINERTEMIIQDVNRLRKMRLQRGALWLRVAQGAGTSIQTPVATATVRGTEFAIQDNGDMSVIDGEVFYEAGGEGIVVFAGERAGVGPDGKPYKESDQDLAGNPDRKWWERLFEAVDEFVLTSSQELVAMTSATVVILAAGLDANSSVPEPASILAMSAGLAYLVNRRRRAKR